MTRCLLWLALMSTAGCGTAPLTREEATDLLSKTLESGTTENLQLATPSG